MARKARAAKSKTVKSASATKAARGKKKHTSATTRKTAGRNKPVPAATGASAGRAGPAGPRLSAASSGTVSVRMYRGLLGDFFLVRHAVGGAVFKMLIDCGVLQRIGTAKAKPSTSRGKDRIVANVKDFIQETGGQVDLVVATHEHYDHLSGFILASDAFQNFKIGKVWMAWTEDRTDKVANGYRNKKKKALAALAALTLNPALAARGSEMQAVTNLLQFYGDIESIRADALGVAKLASDGKLAGNASCEAVLSWLRTRAGADNVSFMKPGEVVRWGVGDAFRAYVLGPPREDDKLLRKLDPSKEHSEVYLARGEDVDSGGGDAVRAYVLGPPREDDKLLRKLNPSKEHSEVYLARGEDVETVVGLAAIHSDPDGKTHPEDQPFTLPHQRSYIKGKKGKVKARDKALLKDPIVRLYRSKQPFDRSIDDEWLGSAENLALKIDGDVNNTSLALALELADKRVLLFPGDAQVGNWLSWGSQNYPADDTKSGPKLKIEEILARTIFYKVGHHASHNATMRERGLELMTNANLSAMIPVVEETAREQKTKKSPEGWAMPWGKLYERLQQRTEGRVIRGDGDTKEEASKFKKSIFDLTYGTNFAAGDPLWVELALKL